jgi:hypothetical protein
MRFFFAIGFAMLATGANAENCQTIADWISIRSFAPGCA